MLTKEHDGGFKGVLASANVNHLVSSNYVLDTLRNCFQVDFISSRL